MIVLKEKTDDSCLICTEGVCSKSLVHNYRMLPHQLYLVIKWHIVITNGSLRPLFTHTPWQQNIKLHL